MITKNDWLKFFPFKDPREEQTKAIDFILNSFISGKKYVIAELGTGLGKSAIGITISKYMQSRPPRSLVPNATWYLTTQKTLQAQYISDFGNEPTNLKTIKSSNNYTCQMFDSSALSMSCAEIQRLMDAHKFFKVIYKTCVCSCRYREEKEKFIEANDSLTNYSYFLAESTYAKGIQPRQLVVCDEAHTLESVFSNFIEIVLSENFSKNRLKLKKFPKSDDNVDEVVKWIKTKYKKALVARLDEVKTYLNDDVREDTEKVKSLTAFVKEYEILDKHVCKVNRFINQYDSKNWVLTYEKGEGKSLNKLVFKPIDVSVYSHEKLFNFGEKILLMSATILDKDTFCKTLGIPQSDAEFIRMPSPFPAENRPIHVLSVGSMARGKIDETLPMIASVVKELLELHPDVKGVIHCGTFRIANYIYDNVKSNRLLIHDSTNREQIIDYHCSNERPTVILSPSMLEGIDLKDDRSRFQILCKLPWPFLGDEVVKKRMTNNPNWYIIETIKLIVQGLGRSIRNENDHAVSYILDSDWNRLVKQHRDKFPKEIIDCIVS